MVLAPHIAELHSANHWPLCTFVIQFMKLSPQITLLIVFMFWVLPQIWRFALKLISSFKFKIYFLKKNMTCFKWIVHSFSCKVVMVKKLCGCGKYWKLLQAISQNITDYQRRWKYEKLGGLSADILRVLVQCAKYTQSMQSMLSF